MISVDLLNDDLQSMCSPKQTAERKGEARFIQEKEMEASSFSSLRPKHMKEEKQFDNSSNQDESGEVVLNVDSETELELELAALEKHKRALRKEVLKSKIYMAKKDIASISHSFSQLQLSKSGTDSKKIGRRDLPGTDVITLKDDADVDIKQTENKSKKGKRGKKSVK